MKPKEYIEIYEKNNISAFARKAGIPVILMHKYIKNGVKPGNKNMIRIKNTSNGILTANDFYYDELPSELPST